MFMIAAVGIRTEPAAVAAAPPQPPSLQPPGSLTQPSGPVQGYQPQSGPMPAQQQQPWQGPPGQ